MKKIPKITLLASTFLFGAIFSPEAHATEDLYITNPNKKNLIDSENINSEYLIIDRNSRQEDTSETNINADENTIEANDSSQDIKENKSNIDKAAPTTEVKSTKEDAVEENQKVKKESDSQTKDLYIYKKVDLDKTFIPRKSTTINIDTKTNIKTEDKEIDLETKDLKQVDKSSDGRYILKTDGKKYYYFDNGVLMKGKDTVLNGKFYNLANDGSATVAKNKWVNVNGVKYYANDNGYTQVGLKKIGNTTYHFEKNGKLSSNKTIYAYNTFYKINTNGIASAIRSQWLTYNGETYYVNKAGGKANGIVEVSGKTHYFNRGVLVKNINVLNYGDKFYKVDSRGVATLYRNTWVNKNGVEYYANADGWRCEGITHIGGLVYNLTKSGKAKDYYAYSSKDNATYYFNSNGIGQIVSTGKPNKDLDVMVGWMHDGMNNKMTYNMGGARTSKNASDCSSAVFRSMITAGFREKGSLIGNTETLFALGKKGEVLKEIREDEIRYGDIFVAGTPGQSIGAGGHTGIILDKNTIIHSNYTDNGISITKRKGRMGDAAGFPVRYYRLVGGTSRKLYID